MNDYEFNICFTTFAALGLVYFGQYGGAAMVGLIALIQYTAYRTLATKEVNQE